MIKVKHIGWGILVDDNGQRYVCDADGLGNVESCSTGKMFAISNRDECDNPISLKEIE